MSEKTLEKLIATLKSEAIEAADQEAKQIVEKARLRAQKTVQEAETTKVEILKSAEQEAQAILDKGQGALQQAARDLNVSVRNELLELYRGVMEREVDANFTPELMETAILKIIENVGSGVALTLPETMETKLAHKIQKQLQASDKVSEITRDATLTKGFSIAKTDEGWSYHITPEAVAKRLQEHLSATWVDLLKFQSEP